ncbi:MULTISPECIES: hypothetical protein [Enterobacter]|uniref:hypothetical protein n=1 Tax=Enterobacter TaxID=547 RepID=UPI0019CF77E0|nr:MULTISPECIES: hypothetical protein [Enterobacter]MCE1976088.1 hypothetical protein [Enterobacter roggenkampii]MCK6926652.1 hypothetical protein [Enterobacter roggenkampii]MEB6513744.1 hypothetical protein [Enterobacter roggenkampii]
MAARQAEDAAIENLRALRQHQTETEQASKDNRLQFRELLSQNGGIWNNRKQPPNWPV